MILSKVKAKINKFIYLHQIIKYMGEAENKMKTLFQEAKSN